METSFEVHTNYQMGGHATLDVTAHPLRNQSPLAEPPVPRVRGDGTFCRRKFDECIDLA